MPRGPLPGSQTRRRNTPTIATTVLPAKGRSGRAPTCPYKLARAGKAWWKWAWQLPQATEWDDSTLYHAARRAQLEDLVDAIAAVETFDVRDLLGQQPEDAVRQLRWLLGELRKAAGGTVVPMREMRELDNRLGLNPKALAELRWRIADDKDDQDDAPATTPTPATARRLKIVDPSAAA